MYCIDQYNMKSAVKNVREFVLYSIVKKQPSQTPTLICKSNYLDSFTNCVVIGLMFQVNSWWYQNLCGLCIRCCFSKSKGDKERVLDMSQVDSASRTSPLSTSPSAQQFSATPSVLAPQSTMRSITVATAVSPTVEPPSAAEADFEIVEKE